MGTWGPKDELLQGNPGSPRWWFPQIFWEVSPPKSLGFHDPIWLAHIFQMGNLKQYRLSQSWMGTCCNESEFYELNSVLIFIIFFHLVLLYHLLSLFPHRLSSAQLQFLKRWSWHKCAAEFKSPSLQCTKRKKQGESDEDLSSQYYRQPKHTGLLRWWQRCFLVWGWFCWCGWCLLI